MGEPVSDFDADTTECFGEQCNAPSELSPGDIDRLGVGRGIGESSALRHLDESYSLRVRPVIGRFGRAKGGIARVEWEEDVLRHTERGSGKPRGQVTGEGIGIGKHLVEAGGGSYASKVPYAAQKSSRRLMEKSCSSW